jgi:flagellar basal body rod protein FlgG
MGYSEKRSSEHIVMSYFYPLEPPIVVPVGTEMVRIDDDGAVWTISNANGHQCMCVGMIELATVDKPDGLEQVEIEQIAENLYRPTAASGRATVNRPGINGTGVLKMGYLEKKR